MLFQLISLGLPSNLRNRRVRDVVRHWNVYSLFLVFVRSKERRAVVMCTTNLVPCTRKWKLYKVCKVEYKEGYEQIESPCYSHVWIQGINTAVNTAVSVDDLDGSIHRKNSGMFHLLPLYLAKEYLYWRLNDSKYTYIHHCIIEVMPQTMVFKGIIVNASRVLNGKVAYTCCQVTWDGKIYNVKN